MIPGLIHVYTGDGKGKTTAALGLVLRAAGRGINAVIAQFLKGRDTGELHALKSINGVTVFRNSRDFGFYSAAGEVIKAEIFRENNENFIRGLALAREYGRCLLVLDEICPAYHIGAINKDLVDDLLITKPPGIELVLTGRNAPEHFVKAAGYVTVFTKQKHPYDAGIAAREGIEF
ncbi:MAG: cob(I)yrinic acid a,c-diamide adenosyltransferase [Clostridiales bacterium]|jgi:cob(I)alamin adenosyltransferase|nr:cob(I)yrinic acid a,c-diamide adenosyltransferase [Clostridiales bacterium]